MVSRRMVLKSAVVTTLTTSLGRLAAAPKPALVSQTPTGNTATRHDTVLQAADGRPVRVSQWSAANERRGLILFSHGALSAPEKYLRLIGPWTAAGFEVRAPLHIDSTDHPDHAKFSMQDSWPARLEDMRALAAPAEADRYVAAGHSYGALVALCLGGVSAQIPPGLSGPLRDPRVGSVLAFSPPGITPSLVNAQGYATLSVPAFIETGTRDIPSGSTDGRWQVHLAAYEAASRADKYALVLDGADHYFGGLICNFAMPGPAQGLQLSKAVALSTLFLAAYGAHDKSARRQLNRSLRDTGSVQLTRK